MPTTKRPRKKPRMDNEEDGRGESVLHGDPCPHGYSDLTSFKRLRSGCTDPNAVERRSQVSDRRLLGHQYVDRQSVHDE